MEMDNGNIDIEKFSNILWLTFNEICHIRYVLTQTNLSLDKQYAQIYNGRLCFRCRKKINQFFFLPSFLHSTKHEICFVCQQIICKKCSYYNFLLPSLKLLIPIRLQTLIKPSSITTDNKKEKMNKTDKQTRTICYDCLQVQLSLNVYIINDIKELQMSIEVRLYLSAVFHSILGIQ